jgi:hypothetical protein
LIELSRDPLFTEIWKIPPYEKNVDKFGNVSAALKENGLYRRMGDCEIVLRFFAFREEVKIKGSVRSMLDRCMEERLRITDDECEVLREDFRARLKLAHGIFGDQVFRFEDENGKWQLSQTLYDGIMIALDRLWTRRDRLLSSRARIVGSVAKLLGRKSAFEVIIGRPNTAKAVRRRMDLLVKAIKG